MPLRPRIPFATDFLQVLAILFFVEFARGAFLMTFLPTYAVNALGYSVALVGTAVTAHYVADTVVKILIGYLLDRFSFRLITIMGLICAIVGLFSMRYVHVGWALISACALYGIGLSPIWLVAVSKVKQDNRATQMGVLYTFWMGGMGVGLVSINFFIDVSYEVSYWILVGITALALLISFLTSDEGAVRVDIPPFAEQFSLLWQKLKDIGALFPGMVLQTTAAGMLVPILPSFATKQLGLSYTQYSYLLIAGGGCAAIGLIPMGKLSDKLGKKWFLVLGFGLFAMTLFLLAFTTNMWIGVGLAAILGLSYSAVLPAWNALLATQVPDEQQGVGWGIFSSLEGIGVMIGPIIGGWLADLFSVRVTILGSAMLLAGIALFYLVYPIRRLLGEVRRV
ncbi:MAG: MFS transporter [Tumebacillaceae bacterium]